MSKKKGRRVKKYTKKIFEIVPATQSIHSSAEVIGTREDPLVAFSPLLLTRKQFLLKLLGLA